jgi:hypothetical protein
MVVDYQVFNDTVSTYNFEWNEKLITDVDKVCLLYSFIFAKIPNFVLTLKFLDSVTGLEFLATISSVPWCCCL